MRQWRETNLSHIEMIAVSAARNALETVPFIVSPGWSPDVLSSHLQGSHYICSAAAAHPATRVSHVIICCVFIPFQSLLFSCSETFYEQLLLAASVSDYHATLLPKTRCGVWGRCTATLTAVKLISQIQRDTLKVSQSAVVGFDYSLRHFVFLDRSRWGTSRWQVSCSLHRWIRTE